MFGLRLGRSHPIRKKDLLYYLKFRHQTIKTMAMIEIQENKGAMITVHHCIPQETAPCLHPSDSHGSMERGIQRPVLSIITIGRPDRDCPRVHPSSLRLRRCVHAWSPHGCMYGHRRIRQVRQRPFRSPAESSNETPDDRKPVSALMGGHRLVSASRVVS